MIPLCGRALCSGAVLRFALSLCLVVGYALGLGGAGALGGEGQDDEGDEVGQHAVEVGADAQLGEQEHAVAVYVDARVGRGDALEEAEEQRAARDVQRLPVAEDHDREGQEAEARDVAVGGAVRGGERVDKAAHAGQRAGDGGARVAHLVDVDAQRVRGLRVLAAGAQPEAEARLVQDYRQDDEQQYADVGREVGLVYEGGAEEAHLVGAPVAEHRLLYHEPAGGVAGGHGHGVLVGDDADEEEHDGGGHEVQGGAADGLVGAEVDAGEAQKQREDSAHDGRDGHGHELQALQGEVVVHLLGQLEHLKLLHLAHEEHADERAEDHDAFKGEVDDAAALGEHAGERDDH